MPANLQKFLKDPNNLGRGAGVYYRRGTVYKGKNYGLKGYFSKYDLERDRKRKSKGYTRDKIGTPRKSGILQSGDGILPR